MPKPFPRGMAEREEPMQTLVDLPEIEVLDGRAERKMSPTFSHARVQSALYRMLYGAAEPRGSVCVEWRYRIGATDGSDTVLVPDIALIERSRLKKLPRAQREEPPLSPDIVVEVRSVGESARRRNEKIAKYLALGTRLVLDADPSERTIAAITSARQRVLREGDAVSDEQFPWLLLDVATAFADLEP